MSGFLQGVTVTTLGRAEQAIRKIAIEVFRGVVMKSPIDQGRFINNWNVSYGTPDTSTTEATNPSRSAATSKVMAAATSLPIRDGESIFICNGLPYARRLEYGHSQKQAPQGMVRVTLAEIAARYGT